MSLSQSSQIDGTLKTCLQITERMTMVSEVSEVSEVIVRSVSGDWVSDISV